MPAHRAHVSDDRDHRGTSSFAELLALGRPIVMGILNVTPDSFSDGGRFFDPARAVTQAKQLIADGADIVDIGAESTRPYGGAQPVSADDERTRLAEVLPTTIALGTTVSIDTMKAEVADWALRQGASIVNDVWGLQRDPDMAPVIASHHAPVVIMHNRDAADPSLDIMDEMRAFFHRSLEIAGRAGIDRNRIVIDPGIGFGKTPRQSMTAIGKLAELQEFGLPILVGASRKRFISTVTPSEPGERLGGSIASHLLAVERGASIVRVHDVAETVQALRIAAAIRSSE
jgi:dihydropteroate synthase